MAQAVIIDRLDNVATATAELRRGDVVGLPGYAITIAEDIRFGHKFALCAIPVGGQVIKYGESIGRATADIAPGAHVHVHNVESLRGRGDLA